jgi:hypothetical protein
MAGAKSFDVRTSGSEKIQLILVVIKLTDDMKLPSHVIVNQKVLPKVQLLMVLIIRCQTEGYEQVIE